MSWDFDTDPETAAELAWIREFIDTKAIPLESLELDVDEFDRAAAPLIEEVKDRGLWAAHLPPEHGGTGRGQLRLALMNEIVGRSRVGPTLFGTAPPDSGNLELLASHATPEQRERYFDPLLAGTVRSSVAMTEPDAGADPTLLSTRLERDGDGWVLNGHKWFATNASLADFLLVMAVSEPEAAPRDRATVVIVDRCTPGVDVRRDIASMEDPQPRPGQIENHCEVVLTDVRLPAGSVLGRPGQAFAMMQERLGPARVHHCMRWIGQAQRALDMLCERATYRFSHGSTLAEKQTVQNWIADSAAEIAAARLLTLHAAWRIDTVGSKAARTDIALIKFYGAAVLHDVIDRAVQAHGSLGFSADLPLESMYRRARAARIYDGPDEVHRQSAARMLLRGYTPPADGVPTEHLPRRRAAARTQFAGALAADPPTHDTEEGRR
ncbi:acyl-CoA dehydrogenase family protein [Pseudonocardia sp. C8]|uniref:acyl-CoA dehydrogenase family protein n=1 Tax=Pseudonocardia sp. C8 TaxID=2762759 RepID=UPI001642EE7C|nr:acyl-CoA dehydrogenase family protein [Pseudonocardia sp. C8]MBC3192165.1 acyl-CoA dehydrogenase family protein [Pseudonocardia sp. C8]